MTPLVHVILVLNFIGACKMTNFLIRLIDAIPVPTPEQGDRAVMYTCTFVAGFVFCMLVNGL